MKDYQQGYATLQNYSLPAGLVIRDPSSGPAIYMKPYTTPNGYGAVATLTLPVDPTLEKSLRLMRMWPSLEPYVYATDRRTVRGTLLVTGQLEHLNMPQSLHVQVRTRQWRWGGFPFYKSSLQSDYEGGVDIWPANGRSLPVVLAGQSDANPSCWTLPLILDGKPEWIRFDHSVLPTRVTASFGQLVTTGSNFDLKY